MADISKSKFFSSLVLRILKPTKDGDDKAVNKSIIKLMPEANDSDAFEIARAFETVLKYDVAEIHRFEKNILMEN